MCKILDDVLPVIGAVVGSFVLPGVGTAIGAGLGGFTGNYVQTHNFGDALGAGALAGATSYAGSALGDFAGGALGTTTGSGVGNTTAAFDTGLGSNVAPSTLGGLESSTGGAAMYGPTAGTGTAIGGTTAGNLGGGGLGMAGGDALSGVSGSPTFLGGLGGGTQGTGLGMGTSGQATADLAGVMNGAQGVGASSAASPAAINSPVSNMSNLQAGQGVTSPTGSPAMGASISEGSQVPQTGAGAPVAFDGGASMEGMQGGGAMPGGGQGAMAAMYGPNSVAPGSTVGQGIANTGIEVPGQGVQFGALGEGTAAAPGGAPFATDIPGQSIGANYGTAATSAQQGGGGVGDFLNSLFNGGQGGMGQLSPWLGLAKSGLGAYQQYAAQRANENYVNQINQEFAPNSPYAQQMGQTLARQDAAAGRNSQYGTRAVQLAAALAQAHATALGNSNYARAATATPGASMLNSLFSTMGNPQYAQGFQQLGTSAFNGLSSLFGG